ncbi:hypothetical protein Pint_06457 [Pistacia integerrima]|uniref:Uncharacterized protein n=1 Tax=Pistacia integerrima TaxID=434235 RepID=A0ACC0Z3Y2_9ROSI|nr:hypothetical protein Pint_06457 [Pistacia integerrima]
MVDLDCKAKMPSKSPKLSNKLRVSIPAPFRGATKSPVSCSDSACSAYEQYLRLPELSKLCRSREFPNWKNEAVLKPALQALEITFRFVSIVLSDPRPYANRREFKRRLESLATSQIQLVANLCEEEDGSAPIESSFVNRTSEHSLLPRLATWHKSEDVAEKIMYIIDCEMRRCPYTLGVGEPNLAGKPNLEYDAVCRPNELHALKKNPYDNVIDNHENQTLYTTHQILEAWIFTAQELLKRIVLRIENKEFEQASNDCYLLERIWKLLAEIEDIHVLMDPSDFLRLKNQLSIKSESESDPFCFRSRGLVEITKLSKDLKHKVPLILGVEVDPSGGPRVQEAAMRLYSEKKDSVKIHLLQGLQAVEAALKRFFYAYKQVLVVVMGSLEVSAESCDSLSQVFLEPTYYPSLDAAKTFLGEFWSHEKKQ